MTEKKLRFLCAYTDCRKETTVIVRIARSLPTQSRNATGGYYCAHCNRANKITVPDNVDVHEFILGRDRGFLRYADDDIPLLQGEKDL